MKSVCVLPAVASKTDERRVEGPGVGTPRPRFSPLQARVVGVWTRRLLERQRRMDRAWDAYKAARGVGLPVRPGDEVEEAQAFYVAVVRSAEKARYQLELALKEGGVLS